MRTIRTVIVSFFFFFIPGIALAHGLVTSQSHTVGAYDIEFEYNELGKLYASKQTVFSFRLLKTGTEEDLPFHHVLVRAERTDGPVAVLASLAPDETEPGAAFLDTAAPGAGIYNYSVRFFDETHEIASSTFPLLVYAPEGTQPQSSRTYSLLTVIVAAIIGAIVGSRWWIARQKT